MPFDLTFCATEYIIKFFAFLNDLSPLKITFFISLKTAKIIPITKTCPCNKQQFLKALKNDNF